MTSVPNLEDRGIALFTYFTFTSFFNSFPIVNNWDRFTQNYLFVVCQTSVSVVLKKLILLVLCLWGRFERPVLSFLSCFFFKPLVFPCNPAACVCLLSLSLYSTLNDWFSNMPYSRPNIKAVGDNYVLWCSVWYTCYLLAPWGWLSLPFPRRHDSMSSIRTDKGVTVCKTPPHNDRVKSYLTGYHVLLLFHVGLIIPQFASFKWRRKRK